MIKAVFTINKAQVYEEIGRTTSYTGSKMVDDENAYERIFTTEGDRSQLERFWDESCSDVCEALKEFIEQERNEGTGFTLNLTLSSSFEPSLKPAMEKELFSFFVMNITGKWYSFTNKSEAKDFTISAINMLEGVKRKAYYRKKPTKPARFKVL